MSQQMIDAFIEKCGSLEEWGNDRSAWHEAMGFFFQGYLACQETEKYLQTKEKIMVKQNVFNAKTGEYEMNYVINEEFLNMPAGREMDVLIAKWIFGDVKKSWDWEFTLPSYSTDISAAFVVAEKLSTEWDFAIVNNQNFSKYPEHPYGFRLQALDKDSHIKTIFALGETAALAICRAALLTVPPLSEGVIVEGD